MPMLEPFGFFWQRVEDNAFHLGVLGGSASPKTMPKPFAEGASSPRLSLDAQNRNRNASLPAVNRMIF
jgi:hypothetical protein